MNNDRKRELRNEYKQTRLEMGILLFHCLPTDTAYLAAVADTRGKLNGSLVKLQTGSHPDKQLQQAYATHGRDAFTCKVLDVLAYDEDVTKTDYSKDLDALLELWSGQYANAVKVRC